MQGINDFELILRGGPGKDLVKLGGFGLFIWREPVPFRTSDGVDFTGCQGQLMANGPGGLRVVPGNHLDRYAGLVHLLQGGNHFFPRGILEGGKAEQVDSPVEMVVFNFHQVFAGDGLVAEGDYPFPLLGPLIDPVLPLGGVKARIRLRSHFKELIRRPFNKDDLLAVFLILRQFGNVSVVRIEGQEVQWFKWRLVVDSHDLPVEG